MEDNREETEETADLFKQPNSSRKRVHSDNGLPLDKDKNVGIAARLRQEGCSVNQNGWSSNELSALYTLIKQFGTGDSALEFVSACGLNRSYEEVAEKVAEIRELSLLYKAEKAKEQRKEFEEVGEQGLAHVLERFPIEPLTKSTHGHWNAAALAVTSHFRGYNHSAVKTAITNAFDQIPNSKITNALATESQLTKAESCKMDVNFEKIRNFLSKATFRTPDSSDLNSLECSILLKIIDDLWLEGYNSTNIKEKAILRGILSIFKDKSENDNIYTYVDFPCDELSATQMYIDPLRSREWNIPNESRKITRNDVDAIRMNPIDGDYLEEDERDLNIPIVHIEPSEVNSSKYPPNSFIGVHALKNKEPSKAETFVIEDALNAIPDEEHTDVQETKVILQRL